MSEVHQLKPVGGREQSLEEARRRSGPGRGDAPGIAAKKALKAARRRELANGLIVA